MRVENKRIGLKIVLYVFFCISAHLLFPVEYPNQELILLENMSGKVLDLKDLYAFSPYIVRGGYKSGQILYYGSYHNIDCAHPQFDDIEDNWNRFKPDLVFSESMRWPLIRNRNKAIERYGEQGLLRYLAYRDKVKIKCIDPRRRKEMHYLMKYYPLSKINIYYVFRQIIIDKEIFNKKQISRSYINNLLQRQLKLFRHKGSPKNVIELKSYVRDAFPELKRITDIDSKYLMDVTRQNNWMAKMNAMLNRFRDRYMIKKIVKALNRGRKIFAVVGKSHVINQENRLMQYLDMSDETN